MPASLACFSAEPMAAALDGLTAMPSTFLVIRSLTTWTCSSPPPCSPGPIYSQANLPPDSASAFLQPSRAWSKNGLFMFFGTSAKVYSAACAGTLPARAATATAAVAIKIFTITPNLPRPDADRALSARAPAADPLQQNRENNEHTDEGALPVGIHAGHQEAVADDLDQGGADEGAEGTALAAHQVGTADHRGRDHAQFIALAQRVDG